MTEIERINQQRFGEFLKILPDLIDKGVSFDRCITKILNDTGWCYITNDEFKIIESIHNYLSQK